MNGKLIAKNKKAFFDYEILDTFEAGLILAGHEAKAAKNGQVNLKGSFVSFNRGKVGVSNLHIGKYKQSGPLDGYEPTRWREILLHKKQINYLQSKSAEKGLTIVPLKVYTKGRLIKVEIGIARGRKRYDKREILKKRDVNKEISRSLKS